MRAVRVLISGRHYRASDQQIRPAIVFSSYSAREHAPGTEPDLPENRTLNGKAEHWRAAPFNVPPQGSSIQLWNVYLTQQAAHISPCKQGSSAVREIIPLAGGIWGDSAGAYPKINWTRTMVPTNQANMKTHSATAQFVTGSGSSFATVNITTHTRPVCSVDERQRLPQPNSKLLVNRPGEHSLAEAREWRVPPAPWR